MINLSNLENGLKVVILNIIVVDMVILVDQKTEVTDKFIWKIVKLNYHLN